MKRYILLFIIICTGLFSLFNFAYAQNDSLDPAIIQKTKQGVVTVNNNVSKAAYSHAYQRRATAFLIDKKHGIFLTNSHVANNTLINNITLTAFNGREITAKFVYSDPHVDFAFLKANPNEIPQEMVELKLSNAKIGNYQPVFLISNNEGKDFSIQTGNIVSQFTTIGFFPQQTISISLNTRGGSSGSPVLDYDGNVIALNFAGHSTYADAIKISYIIDALNFIIKGDQPSRKSLGAFFNYQSLDKAAKYQKFPKSLIKDYMNLYPDALNKALVISQISHGSPAENKLEVGDIIWQVNGTNIGPHLYKMDKIINDSTDQVKITVFRQGLKKEVLVTPKNLNAHRINRMVIFGGAVFYEVNELVNLITGAPLGSLFVTNVQDGSSFNEFPMIYGFSENYSTLSGLRMVEIKGVNNEKINNLDDLIKIIPALVKEKKFTVKLKNYFFNMGMDNIQIANRNIMFKEIEYESYGSQPVELKFNNNSLVWDEKSIS